MLADKLRAATGASYPEFISSSSNRVASNATNTVTAPTGIQNGDLLVAVGITDGAGDSISTLPTGFVEMTRNTTRLSQFVAYKVAASESGNYTFVWNSAVTNTVAILVYRNATRINTVGAFVAASATSFAAPSITPTYYGVLIASYGIKAATSVTTAPSGMTQRVLENANSPSLAVYDLNQQLAAATGDKTIVWSGTNADGSAFLFQVTNEPTVVPEFVASASQQNTTTGGTLVINKPTGTVENDLMVAVMARPGGTQDWTGDTGWTEAADQGTAPGLRIAYKVAGASEGASYTFTYGGTGHTLSGCILTYRYAAYDTIGAFTTATNPLVLPSISPADSQSILIAAGARSAASITLGTPAGMTARVTDSDGTSPSYIVCDQPAADGPTGTRSMSTGSTSSVAGIMLSIKPTRSL